MSWRLLEQDPTFRRLFEGSDSPLAKEIAALRRQVEDVTITDHDTMIAIKNRLYAYTRVFVVLGELVAAEASPKPDPEPPKAPSRYFLRPL